MSDKIKNTEQSNMEEPEKSAEPVEELLSEPEDSGEVESDEDSEEEDEYGEEDEEEIKDESDDEEGDSEEESPEPLPLKTALAYLGGFVIFAAVVLAPVFWHFKSKVWGFIGVEDSAETIWLYWSWKLGVASHWEKLQAAGFTPHNIKTFIYSILSFPVKFRMGNFFDFLPTRLLEVFFPFPVYFNLKKIVVFILNGFCFFLLVNYLIRDRVISFISGVMFAATPFFFLCTSYGWMEQIFLFPVPLYIMYFLKTLHERENKWKNAVLCGLFLGLASILYWYYGMFLVLFTALYFIYYPFCRWKPRNLVGALLFFMIAAEVFLIIVFPFVYPYIQHRRQGKELEGVKFQQDFPKYREMDFQEQNIVMDSCSVEYPMFPIRKRYVPIVVLILMVLSVLFLNRIPLFWYFSALLFYLLSLGPYLKLGGMAVEPPVRLGVYTLLYKYLPFFTRFHWPSRVQSFFILSGIVIGAYTLKYLKERLSQTSFLRVDDEASGFKGALVNRIKIAAAYLPAVLSAFLFIWLVYSNFFLPLRPTPFHVPSYYKEIAKETEEIGLVELPFSNEDIFIPEMTEYGNFFSWSELKTNCYYQTFHNKKIFESYLATGEYPDETDGTIATHTVEQLHPVIKYFCQMSRNPLKAKHFTDQDMKYFREGGYKYLVVHERYFKRIVYYRHKWQNDTGFESMTPEQAAERQFKQYIQVLEKDFGPPVKIDYEYLWDGRPWIYSKEQGRAPKIKKGMWEGTKTPYLETRLQDFYLEKHRVYFFKIDRH